MRLMVLLLGFVCIGSWASEISSSDIIVGETKDYIFAIDSDKTITETDITFGDKSATIKRVWMTRYDNYGGDDNTKNTNNNHPSIIYSDGYYSYWQPLDCTHQKFLVFVGFDERPDIKIPDNVKVVYHIEGAYLAYDESKNPVRDMILQQLLQKVCQ